MCTLDHAVRQYRESRALTIVMFSRIGGPIRCSLVSGTPRATSVEQVRASAPDLEAFGLAVYYKCTSNGVTEV